jgi:hypothetical protein
MCSRSSVSTVDPVLAPAVSVAARFPVFVTVTAVPLVTLKSRRKSVALMIGSAEPSARRNAAVTVRVEFRGIVTVVGVTDSFRTFHVTVWFATPVPLMVRTIVSVSGSSSTAIGSSSQAVAIMASAVTATIVRNARRVVKFFIASGPR